VAASGRAVDLAERGRAARRDGDALASRRAGRGRSARVPPAALASRASRLLRRDLREPALAGPVPGGTSGALRSRRLLGDVPLQGDPRVPLGRRPAAARRAARDGRGDDGVRGAAHFAPSGARLPLPPRARRSALPARARRDRQRRTGARGGRAQPELPQAGRRARERVGIPRRDAGRSFSAAARTGARSSRSCKRSSRACCSAAR
jgi:hypothetical protein